MTDAMTLERGAETAQESVAQKATCAGSAFDGRSRGHEKRIPDDE